MSQIPPDKTIAIFPLVIGMLVILLEVLNKQLIRFIGLKPLSEILTNPRFQRSARITEKLWPLFMVILGISFILRGVGTLFLLPEVIYSYAVSLTLLGLLGLIVLVGIGITFVHWKPRAQSKMVSNRN